MRVILVGEGGGEDGGGDGGEDEDDSYSHLDMGTRTRIILACTWYRFSFGYGRWPTPLVSDT